MRVRWLWVLCALVVSGCASNGDGGRPGGDEADVSPDPDQPDVALEDVSEGEDAPAPEDVPEGMDVAPMVPDIVEGDTPEDVMEPQPASPGCGRAPIHPPGGVNVPLSLGPEGDGERNFYLSMPADYDPERPHKLILGYAGTNWVGEQIQPYLGLEREARSDEIFVYPDPLWRDFEGWGVLGGWVLGPHAYPAHGEGDLVFTEAILDYMAENYCIDMDRVFATGHSWGGDMAQVVSCFLGDRFAATVPVAANRPYWFEHEEGGLIGCEGQTAVWTMFGVADDHFNWQAYPGEFGDECRDFWLAERGCEGAEVSTALDYGAPGDCVAYEGCEVPVRYCLYGPETRHQIPPWFSEACMGFFRGF